MKVYMVEDVDNCPGRIYAVFARHVDALAFAWFFEGVIVVERTLYRGQPPYHGFNE